jgi:hypothetical protein
MHGSTTAAASATIEKPLSADKSNSKEFSMSSLPLEEGAVCAKVEKAPPAKVESSSTPPATAETSRLHSTPASSSANVSENSILPSTEIRPQDLTNLDSKAFAEQFLMKRLMQLSQTEVTVKNGNSGARL